MIYICKLTNVPSFRDAKHLSRLIFKLVILLQKLVKRLLKTKKRRKVLERSISCIYRNVMRLLSVFLPRNILTGDKKNYRLEIKKTHLVTISTHILAKLAWEKRSTWSKLSYQIIAREYQSFWQLDICPRFQ